MGNPEIPSEKPIENKSSTESDADSAFKNIQSIQEEIRVTSGSESEKGPSISSIKSTEDPIENEAGSETEKNTEPNTQGENTEKKNDSYKRKTDFTSTERATQKSSPGTKNYQARLENQIDA